MRIWIDTDIGSDVDDALTLGYSLRHPDLELVGVSTVFGDVSLRTRIAEALLDIDGTIDVEVLSGLGVPLTEGRKSVMFGHEGLGLIDSPEPRAPVSEEDDADERIDAIATAITRAAPDVIVAIGPLTNIAALLDGGHELPRLAIMGGKIEDVMLPGMIPQISEWNWFCDPVAVQRVIGAPHTTRPLVVPAEVTFRTRLDDGDVELLAEGDALAQALSTLSGHWLTAQRELLGSKRPGIALHDPLTAALLVEPSLCPLEPRHITVDDEGAAQRGDGSANIDAAVDVDNQALRDHLMATWLG